MSWSEITPQCTPETLGLRAPEASDEEDGASDVEILLGPTPLAALLGPLSELALPDAAAPLKSHEKCPERPDRASVEGSRDLAKGHRVVPGGIRPQKHH